MVKRNTKPCGTLSGTFLGGIDDDAQPYGGKLPPRVSSDDEEEEEEEDSEESIPEKTA